MHDYPDRNGNVYPELQMFRGFSVMLNVNLLQTKYNLRERKWAHRKMWQKERRFNHIPYSVPSREVIRMADRLVMHPAMWKEIEAATAKPSTYSIGYKHAPESTQQKNNQRAKSDTLYQMEILQQPLGGI